VARQESEARCEVVAHLRLRGRAVKVQGVGAGPIEAFLNALTRCLDTALVLGDYSEHALGALREGASARAIAYVSLRTARGPHARYGVSEHEDVVIASFRAIVSAYNGLVSPECSAGRTAKE